MPMRAHTHRAHRQNQQDIKQSGPHPKQVPFAIVLGAIKACPDSRCAMVHRLYSGRCRCHTNSSCKYRCQSAAATAYPGRYLLHAIAALLLFPRRTRPPNAVAAALNFVGQCCCVALGHGGQIRWALCSRWPADARFSCGGFGENVRAGPSLDIELDVNLSGSVLSSAAFFFALLFFTHTHNNY